MADVRMDFNPGFFDSILKTPKVEQLTRDAAERALTAAKATAPVVEGDYQGGLQLERVESDYRVTYRVVGRDWKTLLIEARLGILARALKAAKQ